MILAIAYMASFCIKHPSNPRQNKEVKRKNGSIQKRKYIKLEQLLYDVSLQASASFAVLQSYNSVKIVFRGKVHIF